MLQKLDGVAVILAAGGVAYFAYAAGDAGPMATFGHGDSNRAAVDAWVQLPVHAVLALCFAVAGPTGMRTIAWIASFLASAALCLWAVVLLLLGLGSLGDYTDLPDVLVSMALLLLYGAAAVALWRPLWAKAITAP